MKDRIKRIMEEQHMSQQVFADFIGLSPATLSSMVEAIKNKLPAISTDWLLMGIGNMYVSTPSDVEDVTHNSPGEPMLDFDQPFNEHPTGSFSQGVRNTPLDNNPQTLKIIDKDPRKVTEIRVYYDDQTYETFVPMKSK